MKRLYRSRDSKILGGVCGGLGEYFNIDPVIFRVIFVLLMLPGGLPGIIPYAVLWLIVPLRPSYVASPRKESKREAEAQPAELAESDK